MVRRFHRVVSERSGHCDVLCWNTDTGYIWQEEFAKPGIPVCPPWRTGDMTDWVDKYVPKVYAELDWDLLVDEGL